MYLKTSKRRKVQVQGSLLSLTIAGGTTKLLAVRNDSGEFGELR